MLLGLLLAAGGLASLRQRHVHPALTLLVSAVAATLAALRVAGVAAGPLPELAVAHAEVDVELVITSDPVPHEGRFGSYVLLDARVEQVTGRGSTWAVRSPVLVIADMPCRRVERGARAVGEGRLQPADGADMASVMV